MSSSSLRFSGMVLRDVRRRAERGPVEEMFLLTSCPALDDEVSGSAAGSAHRFEDQPKLGPAVVYRRGFVPHGQWNAEEYLQGGRTTAEDHAAAFTTVGLDISHVTAMSADEFWAIVELGSELLEREALSTITAALVSGGEDRVKGFAQALARGLFDLDTPELLEVGRMMSGGLPLGEDTGLYLRCAIVLSGRPRYERALEDPQSSWMSGESREAEALLTVCDAAMRRILKREVSLETSPSYETGSNETAWAGRVLAKSDEPPRWTPEEHRAFVLESLHWSAEAFGADLATDPWYQYENQSDWYSCRFIVDLGAAREEVVVLFRMSLVPDWEPADPARVEEEGSRVARALAADIGGRVDGPLELNDLGMHPSEGQVLIHIERRFAGSVAEYLAEYGLAEAMTLAE